MSVAWAAADGPAGYHHVGATMPGKIPLLTPGSGAMQYYWICLRRPANPFAPPWPDISSPNYNPMVVVDAMRFPYTEGE